MRLVWGTYEKRMRGSSFSIFSPSWSQVRVFFFLTFCNKLGCELLPGFSDDDNDVGAMSTSVPLVAIGAVSRSSICCCGSFAWVVG